MLLGFYSYSVLTVTQSLDFFFSQIHIQSVDKSFRFHLKVYLELDPFLCTLLLLPGPKLYHCVFLESNNGLLSDPSRFLPYYSDNLTSQSSQWAF